MGQSKHREGLYNQCGATPSIFLYIIHVFHASLLFLLSTAAVFINYRDGKFKLDLFTCFLGANSTSKADC